MLSFNLNVPYQILSQYLDIAIDNAVGSDAFETHGVRLRLQRRGDSFFNVDGKVIFINTIADIEVFKDVGLFSSEITGVIDINLIIEYNIDDGFKLSTKSEILNYKWIEKPRLEIGIINMPVEKLVELALKHYESIITAKIDASIKENVDLKNIIEDQINELNQMLKAKSFHGISATINPKEVYLAKPTYLDGIIHVKGGLNIDISIADGLENQIQTPKSFLWIDQLNSENLVFADIILSPHFLKAVINDLVSNQKIGGKQVKINNLEVNVEDDGVIITANMKAPVVGVLELKAKPNYVEANQTLDLMDVDFHFKPDGFIYKLSAPLINKFVESKVNEIFPIDLGQLFSKNVNEVLSSSIKTQFGKFTPSIKSVKLEKLGIANNAIQGKVKIENPHLDLKIGID